MATLQSLMDLCLFISPGLFTANALVAVLCLVAGPRLWSRWLCLGFTWINTLLVLTLVADLIYVLLRIVFHGYREETGFIFGVLMFPIFPLALEMVVLLAIYNWRLRLPLRGMNKEQAKT